MSQPLPAVTSKASQEACNSCSVALGAAARGARATTISQQSSRVGDYPETTGCPALLVTGLPPMSVRRWVDAVRCRCGATPPILISLCALPQVILVDALRPVVPFGMAVHEAQYAALALTCALLAPVHPKATLSNQKATFPCRRVAANVIEAWRVSTTQSGRIARWLFGASVRRSPVSRPPTLTVSPGSPLTES